MILSTHFITGSAVAGFTDDPVFLVVVPIILHFLLDAIPHWEYVNDAKELKKKKWQLALDIFSGPAVILGLVLFNYGLNWEKFFLFMTCGAISVMPDFFSYLYFRYPCNLILKKFFAFHQFIHYNAMLSFKQGFPLQILINAIAVGLILYRI